MLKACLEYCEKSSCLILSQLESLCGMGSSFYGHRNHFGVYAGSNGNVLEIPFFSSSLIQLLVLVHTYCILSWVLPSLKVYFSLSAIRLRANVIEKLLLQQTEHVPILSNWKSFPTCEKPWISYPFAVLTSSCQENFVWDPWSLTFWRKTTANGAGFSRTAVSFLLYKHLVPKYTHNGTAPPLQTSVWKDSPCFGEETACRISTSCWMIHLYSGTCKGSSRDNQFLPLRRFDAPHLAGCFYWHFQRCVLWPALWAQDKPQYKCLEMLSSFPLWDRMS